MNPDAEKLNALEAELRRDLEAVERVKRLIASKNGSLSKAQDDNRFELAVAAASLNRNEEDALESRPESLVGTIERIINEDPNIRWTTPKMLKDLQEIGFELKAKKPIYSVGQAIQKLASRHKIRIVTHGLGSAPNVYRARASEEPQSPRSDLPLG